MTARVILTSPAGLRAGDRVVFRDYGTPVPCRIETVDDTGDRVEIEVKPLGDLPPGATALAVATGQPVVTNFSKVSPLVARRRRAELPLCGAIGVDSGDVLDEPLVEVPTCVVAVRGERG
jgi:hypothetical protein